MSELASREKEQRCSTRQVYETPQVKRGPMTREVEGAISTGVAQGTRRK